MSRDGRTGDAPPPPLRLLPPPPRALHVQLRPSFERNRSAFPAVDRGCFNTSIPVVVRTSFTRSVASAGCDASSGLCCCSRDADGTSPPPVQPLLPTVARDVAVQPVRHRAPKDELPHDVRSPSPCRGPHSPRTCGERRAILRSTPAGPRHSQPKVPRALCDRSKGSDRQGHGVVVGRKGRGFLRAGTGVFRRPSRLPRSRTPPARRRPGR